jgi:hypothetical protein
MNIENHFSHKNKMDELAVLTFEQKIKKIQRKKKFKENYKNIELMQNVYEAPLVQTPVPTESVEPSCGCQKKDEDIASYYAEKKEKTRRDIQNMKERIYSFVRSEKLGKIQEGYKAGDKTIAAAENIGTEPDKRDVWYWLFEFPYQMFQYFPQLFDAMIYDLAFAFSTAFTLEDGATTQENDAQSIHNIIALTFSFPLCIYITYNWFFLFAYQGNYRCKDIDPPVTSCRPANDHVRMPLNFDSVTNENTRQFLNLTFDFSVYPLYIFDTYVFGDKGLPALCLTSPSRILVKFILLLISFFVVTWFGFFDTIDSLIAGSSSLVMGFCILCIIWKYGSQIIGHTKEIVELTTPSFTAFAVSVIFFVIRLIIAIFSVNTSSILVTCYFWVHSFFGMVMYGENGWSGIFDEIENMDAYIDEDILWLQDKDTNCFKPELWRKILRIIVTFIYDNFYALSFLSLMSVNVVNVLSNIESPSLKYTIFTLIAVQIFLVGVVMFIHSGKAENRMNTPPATTGGFETQTNLSTTIDKPVVEPPPEQS